jgi:hypothetical protein
MAKYQVNGGAIHDKEEIMRIDTLVRTELKLDLRKFKVVQPWAVPKAPENHKVKLIYSIFSDIEVCGALLALEHPETCTILFNNESVCNKPIGYYVDTHIKTIKLPTIKKGENVLEISMPFGLRTDLESCYLLGNFGTAYEGENTKLIKPTTTLSFSDIVFEGLAFYGGNIDYNFIINLDSDSDLEITIPKYRGAIIKVLVDNELKGRICFSPFNLTIKGVKKGERQITLKLYGNRYNTFSALHNLNADKKRVYIGPDYWRSEGDAWDYSYHTRPLGILEKPIIKIKK